MRKFSILLAAAMLIGLFQPAGWLGRASAASFEQTVTASADLLEINGHQDFNGTWDNDQAGHLYVGMTYQPPEYSNIRNRSAIMFDLGSQTGEITSATLELHVWALLEQTAGHPAFIDVLGSATDSLVNADNAPFPAAGSGTKATFTQSATPFPPDSIVRIDVTDIVKEFTSASDRKITLILKGNEADSQSGRFFIHSLESTYPGAQKPKLKVNYFVNTPPTGGFDIQEGAVTNSPVVHLTPWGADQDPDDSIANVRFTEDPQNWPEWQRYREVIAFNLSPGDGLKTIYMQAQDTHGGVSQAVISHTIILDMTPPTGTIMINGGAPNTTTTNVTLNLFALDSVGDGVTEMRFSNDNVVWSEWKPYAPVTQWNLTAGTGMKTVYAQFKDGAGNVNISPISASIQLVGLTPDITGVSEGGIYNSDVIITFNGTATIDGQSYTSGIPYGMEGLHTLTVTDFGGGVTLVHFTIDKTAPTGNVLINNGTVSANDPAVALTLSAFDGIGTGVTHMRFSFDNAAWSDWEDYASVKNLTLPDGDGTKTVYVQFRDGAGNISAGTISDTIELVTKDTVPPIVTGVTEGGRYNTNVTITFNEGTATLDGSPFTGGSSYGVEGDHTLIVSDSAGNTTTVHFSIDKHMPTGSVLINWGAPKTNTRSVFLILSANDGSGTGVTHVRFSNDNVIWSAWDSFKDSKPWTLSSGTGTKTVYAQFKDAAGNVSIKEIKDTVILQ